MVAQAAIPIVTAVGEFAAPYLIREATKLGIKKFIQNYGGTAFQAISAGVTGGIIAQETPPLDLQNEKLFGTSIGSLPGMPTSYYDDTTEKDKEQEVSTEVKEELPKLPEEEPEGPDIGTELATEAAIQSKKLLEDKELDVSQQTKNLTSKIKNKITTWEDHFPTIEEATKAAKDVGGTLREFEEGVIQNKTTFKKLGKDFEVYFDKKLVAELRDVTNLRKESNDQYKNMNAYNLVLLESSGYIDDFVDSFDGMAYAKEQTKNLIASSLLDKTKSEGGWSSLREKFQEIEYNKKGQPVTEWEREEKELK